jgi:hypothetical protein
LVEEEDEVDDMYTSVFSGSCKIYKIHPDLHGFLPAEIAE